MSEQRLAYGEQSIAYSVQRQAGRKLRSVSIHVEPDGKVIVDAPADAQDADIKAAVSRRARWIYKHVSAARQQRRNVLPREYLSGESHFYLGKRYLLKVHVSSKAVPGVKLLRGRLEVTTPLRDPARVRKLLDAWYRQRAAEVFAKRMAELVLPIRWLKQAPDFRLLSMRIQWGSCSPQGALLFNPQLVKAPSSCIDYVIVHELCHLRQHNHSQDYYRLLASLMPDWQERKQALDGLAEALLNR